MTQPIFQFDPFYCFKPLDKTRKAWYNLRMILNFKGMTMEKKNYQTKGRQSLVDFLSRNPDRQYTAEEICRAVNGADGKGQSSIYRHLSELCREDAVRKFRAADRSESLYQYVGGSCGCRDHFHVKCTGCGRMEHLACGDSAVFVSHLFSEHGFTVDCGQSLLYGLCADCRMGEGAGR